MQRVFMDVDDVDNNFMEGREMQEEDGRNKMAVNNALDRIHTQNSRRDLASYTQTSPTRRNFNATSAEAESARPVSARKRKLEEDDNAHDLALEIPDGIFGEDMWRSTIVVKKKHDVRTRFPKRARILS
jgi:hypothetical protein